MGGKEMEPTIKGSEAPTAADRNDKCQTRAEL